MVGKSGKKGGKNGGPTPPKQEVLAGSKFPPWSCKCGFAGNWKSRIVCKECKEPAPAKVVAAAKAGAKTAAKKPAEGDGTQRAGGAWASGPPSGRGKERAPQPPPEDSDSDEEDDDMCSNADTTKGKTTDKLIALLSSAAGQSLVPNATGLVESLEKEKAKKAEEEAPAGRDLAGALIRQKRCKEALEKKESALADSRQAFESAQKELEEATERRRLAQTKLDEVDGEVKRLAAEQAGRQPAIEPVPISQAAATLAQLTLCFAQVGEEECRRCGVDAAAMAGLHALEANIAAAAKLKDEEAKRQAAAKAAAEPAGASASSGGAAAGADAGAASGSDKSKPGVDLSFLSAAVPDDDDDMWAGFTIEVEDRKRFATMFLEHVEKRARVQRS
jgi:hypothetical protein